MARRPNPRFAAITEEHILGALAEIERAGVPPRYRSHNWLLLFRGQKFPPKYVLVVASRLAPMAELNPNTFSGGDFTNDVFRHFGFEIVPTPSWAAHLASQQRR